MRIGIDLMGSDRSHKELFEAVIAASQAFGSSIHFVVIATPSAIEDLKGISHTHIHFQPVAEVITMAEEPIHAVKHKTTSSIVVGIRLLKKKKIDALVTCGNTGALVTSASLSLTKLPGVKRPALLASLPTSRGFVSVIDVGGSVQFKPSRMVDYAHLGCQFHTRAYGIQNPRIGIMNIGIESKKGTLKHREAFGLLTKLPNFVGNVEGRDVFSGQVDVLVTDGFTGNVLLKTAEGVSTLIFETLASTLSPEFKNELAKIHSTFNYAEYPGAILMGVKGLIIKCHGNSSARALLSGIRGAITLLQKNIF